MYILYYHANNCFTFLFSVQPSNVGQYGSGDVEEEDDENELEEIESAINRGFVNYEMRFGEGGRADMYERIQRAVMIQVRELIQRLRDQGASRKFSVALQLRFHKASDEGAITDPPISLHNGEQFIISPAQNVNMQLQAIVHNLLALIDNFQEVTIVSTHVIYMYLAIIVS